MRDLIEYIAKHLVDRPEEVEVREVAGKAALILELKVGAGEGGMIIGKHGRIIAAIRTIVTGVGTKEGRRAVVELVE